MSGRVEGAFQGAALEGSRPGEDFAEGVPHDLRAVHISEDKTVGALPMHLGYQGQPFSNRRKSAVRFSGTALPPSTTRIELRRSGQAVSAYAKTLFRCRAASKKPVFCPIRIGGQFSIPETGVLGPAQLLVGRANLNRFDAKLDFESFGHRLVRPNQVVLSW